MFIYLSFCLSICLSNLLYLLYLFYLSILSIYLSEVFELDNLQNEAILRDFLNFRAWQHKKRSNSARLPSKMESWVQSWQPRTNAFLRFFDSACLNYCACNEKVIPGHTQCCTCHAKSSSQNWRSDAPKCNPSHISDGHVSCTAPATRHASFQILCKCPTSAIGFGNATKPSRFAHFWQDAQSLAFAMQDDIWTSKSAPNPWVFYTFDLEMCFAPQRRALFGHLNFQKWSEHGVFCAFWLANVLRATTPSTFSTSQLPKMAPTDVFCTFWLGNVLSATTTCTFKTSQLSKVVRAWCVLRILTCKCASRHNGVHFSDMSTSKSGPNLVCFVHFDLQMLRATTACTFWTSQLLKALWSLCFFCTFWLGNALSATTACHFSSLIWPDGSASAALASLLFDPPEPQIRHWKNTVNRDCPTFSRTCIFFLLTLSLLWSSLFCPSLLLSYLSLPISAFSSAHIVGNLTS